MDFSEAQLNILMLMCIIIPVVSMQYITIQQSVHITLVWYSKKLHILAVRDNCHQALSFRNI
jgi:hypothetical protein